MSRLYLRPEYVPVNTDVEEPYTVSVEDGVYVVEDRVLRKCLVIRILNLKKVLISSEIPEEGSILIRLEKAGIRRVIPGHVCMV